MGEAVDVLAGESCLLTLDYAYYHVLFCLLQLAVLWYSGHTKHFRLAHAFGMFAFLTDYSVNYMTTGSRSISYPHLAENLDRGWNSGDEAMGPVGDFLFFLWFDYSAFGVLLWALDVEQCIGSIMQSGVLSTFRQTSGPVIFNLLLVPIQFWSAPLLSPLLAFDSRLLLLKRSSSKGLYLVIILVSTALMRCIARLNWSSVVPVLISGLFCGLVHHAALFTFGMRGYSDFAGLALTLFTEWPALIAAIATIRHLGLSVMGKISCPEIAPLSTKKDDKRFRDAPNSAGGSASGRGTELFISAMWLCLLVAMYPHLSAVDGNDAIGYLIPLIPGQHMQTVGTAYMRLRTCITPSLIPSAINWPPLNCWDDESDETVNNGSDMLVMASAAKSGAVLSARIVIELGIACGLCVASGERSGPGIPGPVEDPPVYEGQLLHAIINMRTWPEYVEKMGYRLSDEARKSYRNGNTDAVAQGHQFKDGQKGRVRCVTLVREPLARLRSLYTYARSGGEHWFRYESGMMKRLGDPNVTLQGSLSLFWNQFGKDYLIQSHEYMMFNIRLGCTPIKMEDFKTNFTEAAERIFRVYGVADGALPVLLNRVVSSDMSSKSEAQRRADAHVTDNKFSSELIQEVKVRLMQMSEVFSMVTLHRSELGYA